MSYLYCIVAEGNKLNLILFLASWQMCFLEGSCVKEIKLNVLFFCLKKSDKKTNLSKIHIYRQNTLKTRASSQFSFIWKFCLKHTNNLKLCCRYTIIACLIWNDPNFGWNFFIYGSFFALDYLRCCFDSSGFHTIYVKLVGTFDVCNLHPHNTLLPIVMFMF